MSTQYTLRTVLPDGHPVETRRVYGNANGPSRIARDHREKVRKELIERKLAVWLKAP